MNRKQWIGLVIFPAAIAALLAFLFFVAEVDAFRERSAAEAIADLAQAGDSKIRLKAALRLKQLGIEKKLAAGEARAVESLAMALKDASPSVRFSAADALVAVAGAKAAPDLAALAKDQDGDVRRIAMYLLGTFDDKASNDVLAAALQDDLEPVRWNAAVALARRKDVRARPVLHDMLRAAAPRSVGRAVSHIVPSGDAPAVEPDADVHANAILGLDIVGDASSIASLERFIEAGVEPELEALARAAIKDIEKRTTRDGTARE